VRPSGFSGTVGIIGAGAAGMYAAKLLQDAGIPYKIFEASAVKGGRIRPKTDFGEKHIELGAEFIHGSKSQLYTYASRQKVVKEKDPVRNKHVFSYYNGKVFQGRELLLQEGIISALRFKSKIEKYDGEDITVEQYLSRHKKKFPEKMWPLVNAFISNTEGTSIKRMGMYSFAKESNRWHSGDDDYNVAIPLLEMLQKEIGDASDGKTVSYSTQIKTVDHSGEKIVLTDQSGQTHEVDKLIVTVSLNVLKSGDIKFAPDLPDEKKTAIKTIGMDGGMKIFLKFKGPFVKEGPISLITDGVIPLMWRSQPNVYTVFVMGEKAEYLSSLGNKAETEVMEELNQVFKNEPGKLLTDFYIQDWLKEPFVKGGYSYASVGTEGQREILALPVGGRVFFAGEATHTNGHNATVHGAMETSVVAVKELLKTV
ncbi:MAG: flavin monoamine oxidase family protein, partial [Bacteroidia bacterium]